MVPTTGYADAGEQAYMVLDAVRTDAYARAIAATVRPDDVVLDIGSGSGLLALLAAKAGARRVFAVERTEMVDLIRAHAKENGLEDRIEVIRADLLELTSLPEPPRVIVGELLGHFAPDEGQHHLYAKARTLSRPDAVTIPSAYQLSFALLGPGLLERERGALADVHGLKLTALETQLQSRVTVARLDPAQRLSADTYGDVIDAAAPLPQAFAAEVEANADGAISAVAVGFRALLTSEIVLDSSLGAPPTHWRQIHFPLSPPLPVHAGDAVEVEIRPRIVTRRAAYRWRVRVGDAVRVGDPFTTGLGGFDDLLRQAQIGFGPDRYLPGARLQALCKALDGGLPLSEGTIDVSALTKRLMSADPSRYPDFPSAEQDVLLLLTVAGATLQSAAATAPPAPPC